MTDNPATPRLWTAEGFREDEWARAESAEALVGNSRIILPLGAFLSLGEDLAEQSRERLGVLLEAGEPLEKILPHLEAIALVALSFPAFNDGRSSSKAALLRSRHKFEGTVRAVGDVLFDQIPLMLRCGFDAFEVSNAPTLKRLEANELNGLSVAYQSSAVTSAEDGKGSWRRKLG